MIGALLNLIIPTVSPERFTEQAIGCARELGMEVEALEPLCLRVKNPEMSDVKIYLANPYHQYQQQKWRKRRIIEGHLSALAEIGDEALIPARVIPTIKDKGYVQEIRAQMAKGGKKAEEFFVAEEYNEALEIVYAVDSPRSIRFLNPADLPELNLHGQTLREFAIDNLKKTMPPVEVQGAAPLMILQAGGMFESSLLLFDRIWDNGELGITGEIVVATPARDVLLVADAAAPEAVEKLQQFARKIAATSAYRLCDELFVRREGKFVVYRPE